MQEKFFYINLTEAWYLQAFTKDNTLFVLQYVLKNCIISSLFFLLLGSNMQQFPKKAQAMKKKWVDYCSEITCKES